MKKIGILSLFAIFLLAGCNKNVEPKKVQIETGSNIESQNETKTGNVITSVVDKVKEDIKEKLNKDPITTGFNVYESKKGDFSLKFNQHRSFQENVGNSVVMFSREGLVSDSKASLSISQLELSDPEKKLSLEDYYNENKLNIRDTITDFTELSQKKIKIDGNTALEVVYDGDQNNQKFQIKQIFFQSLEKVFIITYLASQDAFSDYLSEVDSMTHSLQIK